MPSYKNEFVPTGLVRTVLNKFELIFCTASTRRVKWLRPNTFMKSAERRYSRMLIFPVSALKRSEIPSDYGTLRISLASITPLLEV